MLVRKHFNLDSKVVLSAEVLADKDHSTMTKVVEDALKFYLDYRYLEDEASVIPADIKKAFAAQIAVLEKKLNNRSNQLLSELAIQQGILAMTIAENLEVTPDQIERYRVLTVEFLQNNNRVFRMSEVLNDGG